MTIAPGLMGAALKMQGMLDAGPKHPLYVVSVNFEAMEMRPGVPDLIIGWRGKVQWTPEEHRRRSQEADERLKYSVTYPGFTIEEPTWGNDISTSVFAFQTVPEDTLHTLLKMIDHNFLVSLEHTNFETNKWTWSKGARLY